MERLSQLHGDVFNSHLIPNLRTADTSRYPSVTKKAGGTQKTVLHTHPTELIALTLIPGYSDESRLNKMLFSVQPEAVIANSHGIGLVQYTLPGTEQLQKKQLHHFTIIP